MEMVLRRARARRAAGVWVAPGDSESPEGAVQDNRISGLTIDRNAITIASAGGEALIPAEGGIVLLGGGGYTRGSAVRDVRITRNEIRTSGIGVNLIGGLGNGRGNSVTCVRLSGNRVTGTRDTVSLRANVGNRASLGGC